MDAVSGPNRPEEGQDAAPSALDPLLSMLNDLAAKIQGNAAVTRGQASGLLGLLQSVNATTVDVSTGLTPEQKRQNREIWQQIAAATPETFFTIDFHRLTYLSADAARDLVKLLNSTFSKYAPADTKHQEHFKLSGLVNLDIDAARILSTAQGIGFTLDGLKEFTPAVAALIDGMKSVGNEYYVSFRSMRIDDEAARFFAGHSERLVLVDQNNICEMTPSTVRLALNQFTSFGLKIGTVTKQIAEVLSEFYSSVKESAVFEGDPPTVSDPEAARILSAVRAHDMWLVCPSSVDVAEALVTGPTGVSRLNVKVDGALPPAVAAALVGGAIQNISFMNTGDLTPELARALADGRRKTISLYGFDKASLTDEIRQIFQNGSSTVIAAGETFKPKPAS